MINSISNNSTSKNLKIIDKDVQTDTSINYLIEKMIL